MENQNDVQLAANTIGNDTDNKSNSSSELIESTSVNENAELSPTISNQKLSSPSSPRNNEYQSDSCPDGSPKISKDISDNQFRVTETPHSKLSSSSSSDDDETNNDDATSLFKTELKDPLSFTTPKSKKELEEEPISPQEAREAIENYKKSKVIPKLNFQTPILNEIERERIKAIEFGDYDTASQIHSLSTQLKQDFETEETDIIRSQQTAHLEEKLIELKETLKYKQDEWKEKIASASDDCCDQMQKLLENQDAAYRQFCSNWSDPSFLRQYSKPSQTLLQLRKIERSYALMKDYDRAKEVKLQADNLEKQETKLCQARATQEMRTQQAVLQQQQEKERQATDSRLKAKMRELAKQRDAEIDMYNKRIKKIEFLISHSEVKPTRVIRTRSAMAATPRTNSKKFEMRTQSLYKPLAITPITPQPMKVTPRTIRVRRRDFNPDNF